MTAEIGIMNRLGVALAADSAVTLTSSDSLPKIYTSAEKLFQIADRAPVGSMVYGGANFMGIPWETIIKEYRRVLGDKVFSKLRDYADDFLHFLCNSQALFPEPIQKDFARHNVLGYLFYLREKLEAKLNEAGGEQPISDADIKRITSLLVREEIETIQGLDLAVGLPDDFFQAVEQRYRDLIGSAIRQVFGHLPMTRVTKANLFTLATKLLVHKRLPGSVSGFVIAGFGEDEHFPSLINLTLRGILADQVIYWEEDGESIGESLEAAIMPFAQHEMVFTFMEGINPELLETIYRSTADLFHNVSQVILTEIENDCLNVSADLKERINGTVEELLRNLLEQWNNTRRTNHSDPVMNIVATLPKDELAAMAEALVNLTKFKRRVSMEPETVGGPIDVAVITKGDGFVWIKRKHYFDANLNPRFMSRCYQRGI
jgi:hypothetical protein